MASRIATLILFVSLATVVAPRASHAVSRDVRMVLTAGQYGLVGGTILGLASFPFARSARAIFVGSSVGLYLGIAVGFYLITHRDEVRDDPDNPFSPRYRGAQAPAFPRDQEWADMPPPILEVSVPIARF